MDYDKTEIPEAFDAGRGYPPAVLQFWLERVAKHVPPDEVRDIIDLGAGTGRYTASLAAHFDADVIGIDPSERMLAETRNRTTDGRVRFIRGAGEVLPVPDRSTDLVFLSMVFHHLQDDAEVARECKRVLRPGGRVALRNGTTEQTESYPHVRFFPGIRPIIAGSLPSAARIAAVFGAAGLVLAVHEIVVHEIARSWTALAEKWAHRADSLLARLPDATFEAGMAALVRCAEQADPGESVTQNVDLFVFCARVR